MFDVAAVVGLPQVVVVVGGTTAVAGQPLLDPKPQHA